MFTVPGLRLPRQGAQPLAGSERTHANPYPFTCPVPGQSGGWRAGRGVALPPANGRALSQVLSQALSTVVAASSPTAVSVWWQGFNNASCVALTYIRMHAASPPQTNACRVEVAWFVSLVCFSFFCLLFLRIYIISNVLRL